MEGGCNPPTDGLGCRQSVRSFLDLPDPAGRTTVTHSPEPCHDTSVRAFPFPGPLSSPQVPVPEESELSNRSGRVLAKAASSACTAGKAAGCAGINPCFVAITLAVRLHDPRQWLRSMADSHRPERYPRRPPEPPGPLL